MIMRVQVPIVTLPRREKLTSNKVRRLCGQALPELVETLGFASSARCWHFPVRRVRRLGSVHGGSLAVFV